MTESAEGAGSVRSKPPGKGTAGYGEWVARWKKLVETWQTSGQSQAAYCRLQGLPVTTFNWWKRRLLAQAPGAPRHRAAKVRSDSQASGHEAAATVGARKRARAAPRAAELSRGAFVPVVVRPGGGAPSWAIEVECAGGRALRLRELVSPQVLRACVAAMES